ncbi:MAG: OmpW family protein [Gammaproteobacteria bacterium]|nr:MAG: OmpW family protein [Gammaproteobacteria bacterium]
MKSATVCSALVAAALAAGWTHAANAHEQGDWIVRAGITLVDPKSNNHPVVNVDDDIKPSVNLTYMVTDNIAVDVLGAWPFKHDIKLNDDGSTVGSTKHLPPTLSLQWHFLPGAQFQPYVGAGLNYTTFFSERTTGALEGADLSLGGSFGWALQAGADIMFADNFFLNVDVRKIRIRTEAKLDGAVLGPKVEIDPMVYSVMLGWRF